MSEMNVNDARIQFLALISAAERGESVVVTRFGEPVAIIGPVPADELLTLAASAD